MLSDIMQIVEANYHPVQSLLGFEDLLYAGSCSPTAFQNLKVLRG